MKMKKFIIEKVFERDIDLYIINKFLYDNKFKELFLNKINKYDFNVKECIHSYFNKDLQPYIPTNVLIRKWMGTIFVYPIFSAIIAGIMTLI